MTFSRRQEPGFTLIELMVSLVIIALLFSGVVVGIGALTGTKAKSAAGEIAGTIRSLYDTAGVSGKTCRLVFLMPGEKDEDQSVEYTAECAGGDVTARADRDDALRDANKEFADRERDRKRGVSHAFAFHDDSPSLDELMKREKDRVEQAARFSGFTSEEIKPHKLSPSVKVSVWTQHQRDPAKSGLAYLYFFPQGFTERAQIYVRQGSNVWTIKVAPLTGKTKVYGEELEVPRS